MSNVLENLYECISCLTEHFKKKRFISLFFYLFQFHLLINICLNGGRAQSSDTTGFKITGI